MPVSLRIALRELRAGLAGFRIFLGCLILGVAAIAGVGSLTNAVQLGLSEQGQAILGGDLEIRTFQREATEEEITHFKAAGVLARTIRLRGMTRSVRTGERTLTEIKAVDILYPLYGELQIEPDLKRETLFEFLGSHWGAIIPGNLADRLGVAVGDLLRVGNIDFELRAIIQVEPDQSNEGFQLGPTVMVDIDAMPETGLIQVGSLVNYHYRIKTPPETDLAAWRKDLGTRFPDARWRVRDRDNGAPGLRRFIERMGMFLSLVGLSALVVGGVGVGNAVRAYMDCKMETIATIKTLGGTGPTIFRIYLLQILALALVAIAIGVLVGSAVPFILSDVLSSKLPVPPRFAIFPEPLIVASLYGFLITLAFAVWPLARAQQLPAARLFRDLVTSERHKVRPLPIVIIFFSALFIIALAIGLADLKSLAAGFVAGAAASLLILRLLGFGIQKGVSRLPRPHRPGIRIALANMHRPGAATGAVVLSLGLGLTLFSTIALVEGNLSRQVQDQIPDLAPAFFLLDIQSGQIDEFRQKVSALEGITELRSVPSLRGRIIEVAGVPADEVKAHPESQWVLNGDRSLTYATEVPEGNRIVEGEWWPADYDGPPLISFSADEARGLGIKVGDELAVNILGREIRATVANLRQLEWGTFGFNFVVVFAPGALETAPHTFMASLKVEEGEEVAVHRAITDAFPNVTAIRTKEIFTTLTGMLDEIGLAIRATAAVGIIAGILVLAGAIAAGHRHRVYDAVILKILGAVRKDVLRAFIIEYVILGIITGFVALLLGTLAGYMVVEIVMEIDFVLLPQAMLVTVLSSIVITVFFGLVGTWSALGVRPVEILRNP